MKRSDFLKSVLAIIAAPSLMAEIGAGVVETGSKKRKAHIKRIGKKIVCWFVLTEEMQDDKGYMNNLIHNNNSELWKKARAAGINHNEAFEYKIGYNDDDFIHNRLTLVLSQYKYTEHELSN